ncbi:hypothetical protein CAPTEDRAFT_199204, partial [Capitella teleta]
MANMKMDMAAYPYGEQNMMLVGLIAAAIKVSDMTCSSKLKRQKKREHPKTIYMHEGQQICISTFKFIFGARLKQHEFHLERVGEERTFHKSMVEEAKKICTSLVVTELSASAPCSQPVSIHYKFRLCSA